MLNARGAVRIRLRRPARGLPLALVLLAPAAVGPVAIARQAAPVPATATEVVAAARQRLAAGDPAAAIAILEPVVAAPAAPPAVRVLLAGLYVESGRPADALAVVAPLTAADAAEADGAALFVAARAEMALGRPQAAEELLVRSAAREPVSQAAVLLAAIRTRQERHQEAADLLAPVAATLDRVAENDPSFAAEIALHYGRTLLALGRREEAVAPLTRATELAPHGADGWQLLAGTLLDLERFDEGRRALARAQQIELAAHQAEVAAAERRRELEELLLEAAAHHRAGRFDEALVALREARSLDPEALQPRLLEVRLLVSRDRAGEALPFADELVRRAPDHPDARHLRGVARLATGDAAGAESDLRRALALAPDHLGAGNGLALVLAEQGRTAEAIELLDRMLARTPDDPVALRTRARLIAGAATP